MSASISDSVRTHTVAPIVHRPKETYALTEAGMSRQRMKRIRP